MAPGLERPRITEIHVRMDCNGCVQKVKKALHGVNGIYDLYIDFPQQKVTVVGWADPERIMKAIKKVRKVATICSHTEVPDPNSQQPESVSDGGAPAPPQEAGAPQGQQPEGEPAPDAGVPQPVEPPKSEESQPPPQEPPRDQPPPPQPPENQPPQDTQPEPINPAPPAEPQQNQPTQTRIPRDSEEVHVIHRSPPEYGYRNTQRDSYGPRYRHDYGGHSSFGHERRPGNHVYHEAPREPDYHERPRAMYREPPHESRYHERGYREPQYDSGYHERPRPIYHEPPYNSGYHDRPRTTYYEPPPRPTYHHEPAPEPTYHDPPPRSSYQEAPRQALYNEPPPHQALYNEPPPRAHHHEPPLPQPISATHNYNTYRPSSSMTVTEYQYVQSPPRYTPYSRMDHYNMDPYDYQSSSAGNGNVSSIFSDENPNACTIV